VSSPLQKREQAEPSPSLAFQCHQEGPNVIGPVETTRTKEPMIQQTNLMIERFSSIFDMMVEVPSSDRMMAG
jgi:hypothetical protein